MQAERYCQVDGQLVRLDYEEKPSRFPWFAVGFTLTVVVLAIMGVLK